MIVVDLTEAERCAIMSGLRLLMMNTHLMETGQVPYVQPTAGARSTDPMAYAQDRQIEPLVKDQIEELLNRVAVTR